MNRRSRSRTIRSGNRRPRRAARRTVNRIVAEENVIKSQLGNLQRNPRGITRRVNRVRRVSRVRRNNSNSGGMVRSQARRGPTALGQGMRLLGTGVGAYLGNPTLGSSVGAGISRIFGQGDYTVTNNSLVHGGPPSFASLNSGMRVAHREYVGDVLGSILFKNQTYQISPTNSQLFPWLSKLATNFEEYDIHGLVFYFNTTCGSAISSTNNALGVVGMTTAYDPTDPDFGTKREAEDYGGCVSGVPSCSLLHPVECKPRSNVLDRLYTLVNPVVDPEDLKFYSHGKLNVFTQGMQIDNVNLGELWVSYDIEFFNPKILPVGTIGAAAAHVYASTTTQTNTQVLGTVSLGSLGNIAMTYDGGTGYFTIPRGTANGYYYLSIAQSGSVTAATDFSIDVYTNIAFTNYFQDRTGTLAQAPSTGVTSPEHAFQIVFNKLSADAATFHLKTSVLPTGTVKYDVSLFKIPSSTIGIPDYLSIVPRKDNVLTMEGIANLLQTKYGLRTIVEEQKSISESDCDSDDADLDYLVAARLIADHMKQNHIEDYSKQK